MTKATLNQSQELLKLVAQSGIEKDALQTMLESGKFTAFLKAFIESGAPAIDILKVMVDYDMTLEKMIEAGRYDWTNDDITDKHFPINKRESGEVELHVVHFGRDMTTKQVLAELDKQGLRPAELPELLALGATHPDLQRKFPLVALGSGWRSPGGYVSCPVLGEDGDRRGLSLRWRGPGSRWGGDCRFVAVSK